MYTVPLLMTLVSFAHASMMGGYMGGMYGMGGRDMYGQRIMGLGNMVPDRQGVSPNMMDGELCRTYCGNQMTQTVDQATLEASEEAQMRQMTLLMNDMRGAIQRAGSSMDMMESKAEQMAQNMLMLIAQGVQTQMQQIMEQMIGGTTSGMGGSGRMMVQNLAKQEAMKIMKEMMMMMSSQSRSDIMMASSNQTKQMEETLKVAIRAQLIIQKMASQKSANSASSERIMEKFFSQVRMMLQQYKMIRTQAALKQIYFQSMQTQVQQQFLNNQMQTIQMSQMMMDDQQRTMQDSQQQMYQQQEKLIARQLAEQMAMDGLERMISSQRKIMQELTEQQAEISMRNPSMYMSSMRMMPKMMQA